MIPIVNAIGKLENVLRLWLIYYSQLAFDNALIMLTFTTLAVAFLS
jgi:hypothetical protein